MATVNINSLNFNSHPHSHQQQYILAQIVNQPQYQTPCLYQFTKRGCRYKNNCKFQHIIFPTIQIACSTTTEQHSSVADTIQTPPTMPRQNTTSPNAIAKMRKFKPQSQPKNLHHISKGKNSNNNNNNNSKTQHKKKRKRKSNYKKKHKAINNKNKHNNNNYKVNKNYMFGSDEDITDEEIVFDPITGEEKTIRHPKNKQNNYNKHKHLYKKKQKHNTKKENKQKMDVKHDINNNYIAKKEIKNAEIVIESNKLSDDMKDNKIMNKNNKDEQLKLLFSMFPTGERHIIKIVFNDEEFEGNFKEICNQLSCMYDKASDMDSNNENMSSSSIIISDDDDENDNCDDSYNEHEFLPNNSWI